MAVVQDSPGAQSRTSIGRIPCFRGAGSLYYAQGDFLFNAELGANLTMSEVVRVDYEAIEHRLVLSNLLKRFRSSVIQRHASGQVNATQFLFLTRIDARP